MWICQCSEFVVNNQWKRNFKCEIESPLNIIQLELKISQRTLCENEFSDNFPLTCVLLLNFNLSHTSQNICLFQNLNEILSIWLNEYKNVIDLTTTNAVSRPLSAPVVSSSAIVDNSSDRSKDTSIINTDVTVSLKKNRSGEDKGEFD